MAVVNNVKKEGLEGKARMTLSGIAYVIVDGTREYLSLQQSRLHVADQRTCTKEEFDIQVVNQRYDILTRE
jgi:hypothetical protein